MADIESFTYIERATAIVSNVLGKNATQEQVIKAVDSVWAINSMGLPYPGNDENIAQADPETRARFFVESVKRYLGAQIEAHANQVALAENEQAITDSKDDYVGDFNKDEVLPT